MSEEMRDYQVSNDSEKIFDKILKQINESAGSIQRDRGTYFEKLVEALKNEDLFTKIL